MIERRELTTDRMSLHPRLHSSNVNSHCVSAPHFHANTSALMSSGWTWMSLSRRIIPLGPMRASFVSNMIFLSAALFAYWLKRASIRLLSTLADISCTLIDNNQWEEKKKCS